MPTLPLPQYRAKDLWHDGRLPMLLGCSTCRTFDVCGGLNVAAVGLFSCRSLCSCHGTTPCSVVCTHQVRSYARYIQEVGGFSLDNVPRAAPAPVPSLPRVVPMIYGRTRRPEPLQAEAVAVPLAAVFDRRTGKVRFSSREDLCRHFSVVPTARLVLSGVDVDRPVERYWSVARGAGVVQALAALGPDLVTVPNFSLPIDCPREDNLRAMKRIAICCQELLAADVPAALHVNARTDHDWRRWAEFIGDRGEIRSIAFEFGTGSRLGGRGAWHAEQLCRLRERVSRDLQLVVRGERFAPALAPAYPNLVCVDTSVYVKTMKRFRLVRSRDGGRAWRKTMSFIGQPLDRLFQENVDAATGRQALVLSADPAPDALTV